MAEGLLRHHLALSGLAKNYQVKSAGTRVSSPGARPDQRASKVAEEAGVNLDGIRAGRVTKKLLQRSDLVLAMDHSNLEDLQKACPPDHLHKLALLLSYLPAQEPGDVPDPYYGSTEGFRAVFEQIEAAVRSLLPQLGHPGSGVESRLR
jgi:protein-tyrosine phosphatase